jgi:hypothetical protein
MFRVEHVTGKGRGMVASTHIPKDTAILVELPLVSTQFLWNAKCKYSACQYCLSSMEPTLEMARCPLLVVLMILLMSVDVSPSSRFLSFHIWNAMLSTLPCSATATIAGSVVVLPWSHAHKQQEQYCCDQCKQQAWRQYHETLCTKGDPEHILNSVAAAWMSVPVCTRFRSHATGRSTSLPRQPASC